MFFQGAFPIRCIFALVANIQLISICFSRWNTCEFHTFIWILVLICHIHRLHSKHPISDNCHIKKLRILGLLNCFILKVKVIGPKGDRGFRQVHFFFNVAFGAQHRLDIIAEPPFGLKVPSEMEVAPHYNCWHCWHCWHCSTLFDTVRHCWHDV